MGASVAENSVTPCAAAQRDCSSGPGTTLRMASTGWRARPCASRVRSAKEWSPKLSATRAKCSASNHQRTSGPSAPSCGCSARWSPMSAHTVCSAAMNSAGNSGSTSWSCTCVLASALQRRCSLSSGFFSAAGASLRSAWKAAGSSVALCMARARSIRLCASSTSRLTRHSWASVSACQAAPWSKKWFTSPTATSHQRSISCPR